MDNTSTDVGNSTDGGGGWLSGLSSLSGLITAAAPLVTAVKGSPGNSVVPVTTQPTITGSISGNKPLLIGIAATVAAVILGVILFAMRRGK